MGKFMNCNKKINPVRLSYLFSVKLLSITILILCLQNSFADQLGVNRNFNVQTFGAIADGKTLDTEAIQSAIDAAHQAGGGAVLFPAGVYLSGSLHLKSHVELRFETNATLLGSSSFTDYEKGRWYALLLADRQTDIRISGEGIIDGQGLHLARDVMRQAVAGKFGAESPELQKSQEHDLQLPDAEFGQQTKKNRPIESERPLLIEFRDCQRIKVTGVTLRNSSCWVENYVGCQDLVIDGIKVDSTAYWNNDGMDISDCCHVKISNCTINSDDDGICLKSDGKGSGCWNVEVSDCRIRSSASAFKLGTASCGGFHKIRARNLTINDTYRSAIALESVDGGVLDDVVIEHVRATNTGNTIFLRLGQRNNTGAIGQLKNVVIRDVKVEVPVGKPDVGYEIAGPIVRLPHNVFPSSIVGLPGHPVSNIYLDDIEISYPGGSSTKIANVPLDALQMVPENPTNYPEFSMFGELPSWGFYVRHAEGVKFNDVRIKIREPDFRPALVFDDVSDLQIEKTIVESASQNPVMVLNNVQDARFDMSFPAGCHEVRKNPNCNRIIGLMATDIVSKQVMYSEP